MANRTCRGSKVKSSRLHESIIPTILSLLRRGQKPATIAAMFGVSMSTISRIRHNLTWKHVKRKKSNVRSPIL